jgi:hypothetical protein
MRATLILSVGTAPSYPRTFYKPSTLKGLVTSHIITWRTKSPIHEPLETDHIQTITVLLCSVTYFMFKYVDNMRTPSYSLSMKQMSQFMLMMTCPPYYVL